MSSEESPKEVDYSKFKIHIVCPNVNWIHKYVAMAIVRMCRDDRYNHNLFLDMKTNIPIDNSRNEAIKEFLESEDATHLLFIDSDNPPMGWRNPLDLVELDKDIMILPTPMWKSSREEMDVGVWPIKWNAMVEAQRGETDGWRPNPYPNGGLQEIDAGGSGCMIIARRVLEKVRPAFIREYDEDGCITKGSDFLFCKRAKEAGFSVWAHYGYPCHHFKERDLAELYNYFQTRDVSQLIGKENINTEEYWDEQWGEREEREYPFYERILKECEGKRVLDFGCGRGDLLAKLQGVASYACGMDISGKAVEICHERGLHAYKGTAPTGRYDIIVATEVMEHLDDDLGMIQKMFECANKVIYTVPHNCLPPQIEPEHMRVYTINYVGAITPHLTEIVDFGRYLLAIAERTEEDVKAIEQANRERQPAHA